MRFGTWNLNNYGRDDTPEEHARAQQIAEVIADLGVDVLAVQEIRDPDGYEELAAAAGMACRVPTSGADGGSVVALDPGRSGCGLGLMWQPEVEPILDSMRIHANPDLHHGMVRVDIPLNGQRVTAACTHLAPWGKHRRYDEATVLAGLLRQFPHVIVFADWNCVSGARTNDDGGEFYDADPFAGLEWQPRFLDKCDIEVADDGTVRFWADRRPMQVLDLAGLYDLAAVLNAPWYPTVGHWYEDAIPKRIDGGRATESVAIATLAINVIDDERTRQIGDHLPVVYDIDPARIRSASTPE